MCVHVLCASHDTYIYICIYVCMHACMYMFCTMYIVYIMHRRVYFYVINKYLHIHIHTTYMSSNVPGRVEMWLETGDP